MENASKPRRRWFTFSLRTLFVMVTVISIWLSVQVKWIRDRHAVLEWCKTPVSIFDMQSYGANAPWSIRILGEPGYGGIIPRGYFKGARKSPWNTDTIKSLFPESYVFVVSSPSTIAPGSSPFIYDDENGNPVLLKDVPEDER